MLQTIISEEIVIIVKHKYCQGVKFNIFKTQGLFYESVDGEMIVESPYEDSSKCNSLDFLRMKVSLNRLSIRFVTFAPPLKPPGKSSLAAAWLRNVFMIS